jgi:hypothetical protein
MASYLDAVFAFFGDDEPTDELRDILIERIEPTDEELEEILSSNDGTDEGKKYCQYVHDMLLQCCANTETFVPRKSCLAEVVEMRKAKADNSENVVGAGVNMMLSGAVQVAQPPRTTPIRPAVPVAEQPASQPPSQGQGDAMRRERKDGRQRDEHQDDGQRGRHRFVLSHAETVEFHSDPQKFINKFPEGSSERLSLEKILEEIKTKKPPDPITREMREATNGKQWKGIYEALLNAYLTDDSDKKVLAAQLRDSYSRGIYGARGRALGALMRQCMKDLDAKLNIFDLTEFNRRYVG